MQLCTYLHKYIHTHTLKNSEVISDTQCPHFEIRVVCILLLVSTHSCMTGNSLGFFPIVVFPWHLVWAHKCLNILS